MTDLMLVFSLSGLDTLCSNMEVDFLDEDPQIKNVIK